MHLDERRAVAAGLATLSAVVLVLTAWQVTTSVRLYLDTAFVLFAPGWAIVAHLRLATRALQWLTAIALGMSGTLLLAQIMIALDWWHPIAAFILVAGATLFELLRQATTPGPARSGP